MKTLPVVMAKTRICAGLESSLNDPNAPTKTWLRSLKTTTGYMAASLLDDMPLHEWSKGKPRADPPVPADRDCIKDHVLGLDSAGPWWDSESHEIATEALARAIWLLTHHVGGARRPRRKINWWWSCPSTHTFRVFFLDSGAHVTAIISTPPLPSHRVHWEEYLRRRDDSRLRPDDELEIAVLPTRREPHLIVSSEIQAVSLARRGGAQVPIAKELSPLTQKTPNARTMQPLCRAY